MTPDERDKLPYRENVGMMLINSDRKVFVGQRRDNLGPAWQMPQGGIDVGETPQMAAMRELEEETGVSPDLVHIIAELADWIAYDLPLDLVSKLWHGRFRGQRQKWFLMRFIGADSHVNIVTAHPEFSCWQWLSVDQLLQNIVPFKRPVYAQVIEAFESHL